MAVHTESESGFLNHSKQCQSFFLIENELNSAVVVISGWLVLVHVDATRDGTGAQFSTHSTRLFNFAAVFILVSHIGVLALEDLELKLDRLRFEIILMGFIFPMEKKIAGRFCIKKPEQQTGQRAGRIVVSHQPF